MFRYHVSKKIEESWKSWKKKAQSGNWNESIGKTFLSDLLFRASMKGKKWKIRDPTEDWSFWWILPYLSTNEGNIRNSVIKRLFRLWCKVAAKKTAQLNIPIRISWIVLLLTSLEPFFRSLQRRRSKWSRFQYGTDNLYTACF